MEPATDLQAGRRAAGGTKQAMGSALAVAWFILLFIATIGVATVTLSASQLQSRLLAFSQSDTPFSVWQIERIRKSWDSQQAIISAQAEKVTKAREAIVALETRDRLAADEIEVLADAYARAVDDFLAKARFYQPDFDAGNLSDPTDSRAFVDAEKRALSLGSGASDPERALLLQFLDTLKSSRKALLSARNAAIGDAGDIKVAVASLEREEAALKNGEARLKQIIDPYGQLKAGDHERIYDLISEFAFMEKFALGTLYKFAILPNEFLIIVLVITMGVLGSTLQLTYLYYRQGGIPQISMFFLRPMLGAITAIVVFVLLKAGVLVVTDSAKLGEVAPLNPFFISFVGIVSGLLSENALETVRRVGESWFKGTGSDFAPRWASGVKQFVTNGKSVEDLAAKTGLDVDVVNKWVEEEEPVPLEMQKLIAAWLDRDMRTLFTDIPPTRTA
jgi:hypothetical protein